MIRKRLRFGAHHHRPNFRRDLDYPVDTARQIVRLRLKLTARLRQMLVANATFPQQLPQNHPIKLRPPRPRNTPHIAKKFDLILLQQFEKISKRMTTVADGVNIY